MKLRLIATAALALVAGTAAAQPPAPGAPGRGPGMDTFGLLKFDSNADGKLTKAEFDASQRARFDKIDANKDGSITSEERQAFKKAAAETRRTELNKVRFTELDKDKSGQLSQSEFAAGGLRMDAKAAGRHNGGPRQGGPRKGSQDRPERVKADGDKGSHRDASVSFADFAARGAESFARADANKDGTVTIAELQAMKPARP